MDLGFSAAAPVVDLVKKLMARRKPGRVYVRKGGVEISMTTRAATKTGKGG
jgi:hypothetical protein